MNQIVNHTAHEAISPVVSQDVLLGRALDEFNDKGFVAHDVWSGLLRGGDDAGRRGAL